MPTISTLSAFALVCLGLALTPGPNMIYLVSRSISQGRGAALISLGGTGLGFLVYMVAAAFGITALLFAIPLAYDGLRLVGAAYLLYLAYRSFRAAPESLSGYGGQPKPLWQMYVRGIGMNLSNPKVALFFLAFLPQFTAPAHGHLVWQMLTLGAIFIACALASFAVIALLAGSLSQWLQRSRNSQTVLNRVAGGVFVGLAMKLATSHR